MMVFRIADTEIRVEFGFLAVCALLSAMGDESVLLYGFAAVILHETAHLAAMFLLGMKADSVIFHACGIRICPENRLCSYGRELAVLIAGPFANIAAWGAVSYFHGNMLFAQSQLALGILNILPCRRLDGGSALCCLLSMTNISMGTSERLLRIIFILTPMILLGAGYFGGITNFTYYALALYLLFSEIFR
ncbi:MAG: hypothetical protein ACI4JN_00580 [Ruminococcus sp.]